MKKHRSSNQRPWTTFFHRMKFHRSWCRLAIANSERLLRTAISMNKSLYSYNKKIYKLSKVYTFICNLAHRLINQLSICSGWSWKNCNIIIVINKCKWFYNCYYIKMKVAHLRYISCTTNNLPLCCELLLALSKKKVNRLWLFKCIFHLKTHFNIT